MRVTLEPLVVDRDLDLLHSWVTHPRSVYWDMQDATREDVAAEYRRIDEDPHHGAFLGRVDGEPAFLVELYDPAHSELAHLPDLRPGDLGMHVLVAPPSGDPVPGFTRDVFGFVVEQCFARPGVRRVVVEPDARNERILAMNAAHGFEVAREVELPTKTAALSFLDRPTAHLTPDALERAQRHLVAKALAELAHERLLAPSATGPGAWSLTTPAGDTTYSFTARRHPLDHWVVDPGSIVRTVKDEEAPVDVLALVTEHAEVLGLPDQLLPTYLEELSSTLASHCWKQRHADVPSADLVHADFQTLEAAMTEGHPAFIANNGRIGFGLDDYERFAPEAGQSVRLVWLAARRSVTRLSLGVGLSEAELYAGELDQALRDRFDGVLRSHGLDPADYLLLPVHPWQWTNKVAITFAPDLARHDLVHLGEAPDELRAQQSIRTFFNTSRPERHYVKVALSIQNMGFMRGLSPAYMGATPAINDWVASVVESDPTLQGCGFGVLRERAAVGYTGDAFHGTDAPSPYRKMLAALWRESPVPRVGDGERLMTMAGLLHRDSSGRALVAELVEASGREARSWVRDYLHAYVRPIVHCLLAHDLAFMPHGENLVLVLRGHVPVRAFMKDIGEEVAVMSTTRPLPADVERIRIDVDQDVKTLALHTDVFDGFLRHLAGLLDEQDVLPADEFWAEVAHCLEQHAAEHPDLADAVAAYDFLRPEFKHSCLNRLQLRNTLQMVDLADQASSLMYAGTLRNPLAR